MNSTRFRTGTAYAHALTSRASRSSMRLGNRQVETARCGAAVVELALVMPFLMVIVVGMIELGQGLKCDAILSEAVRAGCATGTRPGCSNVDVTNDVTTVLSSNGLPASSATITILVNNSAGDVAAAGQNDKITVTVSIPAAQVIVANTLMYFGGNSKLSQTLTMLKQG